eukprot:scaffold401465_cov18-Prasinocladus_malaysianus.AAC.1
MITRTNTIGRPSGVGRYGTVRSELGVRDPSGVGRYARYACSATARTQEVRTTATTVPVRI